MRHLLQLFIIVFILIQYSNNSNLYGQSASDTITEKKKEKKKEGLNWNPFPVLGYNTDIGFQYGLLLDLYNYGDGTLYPDYKYSIYSEISRTTKGGGVNQLFFDSKYLLPYDLRITADLSYLTEMALNFYGFNGYEAAYNSSYEDDDNEQYISRMFYRHQRKFTRFTVDLQGKLYTKKLLWLGGFGYFDTRISTVNIDKLNKGKNESDKLPDSTALLYDEYVNWGIIGEAEKTGGKTPYFKAGLIFDTRDVEANPMKGIWTEVLLFMAPEILGNKDFSYIKLALTHRQYFTVIKDKLSFVYRIGYQGTIAGTVPFYMQPYMITSFAKVTTTDGLGGAKTIRGVLRNRVVGDGIVLGNFEARWKFLQTTIANQNIYLGLNAFADAGMVVQKRDVDLSNLDPESQIYFVDDDETMHWSVGGGFRIVKNQNFVIAVDYGIALDNRDGKDGLYVGIGYLF